MISRWAPGAVAASGLAPTLRGRPSGDALGRFGARVRHRTFWLALGAVVAAELAALLPIVLADEPVPGYRAVFRLIGGVFAVCGLIAWQRRPDSRSGLLMVATGFGLLVDPVFVQLEPGALRTVGDLFEDAWGIPIIALLLTFLTGGRLTSRVDRVLVGVFVLALVLEFVRHLFLAREGNFLFVRANAEIAEGLVAASELLVSIGCLAVAVVIGARWKAASAPRRRAMLPSVAGIACLLAFAVVQQATPLVLQWLAVCSLLAIPAAFLAGLLRSRLARGGLAELFRELSGMRGPALQAALARTLGDPTLVLARRLPDSPGYAEADGKPVLVPPVTADRTTAPIGRDGDEVAVLVYDALLDDDPELVEAVIAAAAIALESERLQAVSEARLVELQASRERIVTAGDAERRRLERDLHDGAQQRMVAIALQLRLVQGQIHDDPALAEELVKTASSELALSLSELRELARGIHPAVLEHGLSAALDSLAVRSTVPTTVSFETSERLPERLEFAAYFVASEALANVAKYSHATKVTMRVWRTGPMASIEIADDGVGGADDSNGSGLRGLADRVESLNGHLQVRSAPGTGTVVTAEMPCG